MKLMDNDKYRTCVAFGIAGLTIVNLAIIKGQIKRKERVYDEPVKVVEFEETKQINNNFVVSELGDMVDVMLEFNIEEKLLPYKSYKLIEFKDSEGYYRIMPVVSELGYIVNSDKQIIGEYYDVYDAFSDVPLFKMNGSIDNIDNYNDLFTGAKIISYEDFSNIRKISYLHGASYEFIDSVMPVSDEYNLLSNTDIAIAYGYLIPENYRVVYNDLVNKEISK